jgi:hypothetical protein
MNQDLLEGLLMGSAEQQNEILAILGANKTDNNILRAIADAKGTCWLNCTNHTG